MAKVNKLALARLALRTTLRELDTKELLCVLADLYAGTIDTNAPRWYGNGGGASGLEQGVYNSMITFRRVSNLWMKISALSNNDKQETIAVRDLVVKELEDRGTSLDEIKEPETNE